jgi:hypothetical protein
MNGNTPSLLDYKENKAYELRKKAALLNRIMVNKIDPIYTRSHPVTSDILIEQTLSPVNCPSAKIVNCSGGVSSSGARKRLFAKKNETLNSTNGNSGLLSTPLRNERVMVRDKKPVAVQEGQETGSHKRSHSLPSYNPANNRSTNENKAGDQDESDQEFLELERQANTNFNKSNV